MHFSLFFHVTIFFCLNEVLGVVLYFSFRSFLIFLCFFPVIQTKELFHIVSQKICYLSIITEFLCLILRDAMSCIYGIVD